MKDRVCVVIPAFNEEKAVADVVARFNTRFSVIVVDDGSTDQTAQLALNAGAVVLENNSNQGYNKSLHLGISKAISDGFSVAVTIDADGQFLLIDAINAVQKIFEGFDVVVGRRPAFQRGAELIFSVVSTKVWGILDPLCGLKAYKLDKIIEIGVPCSYDSVGTELLLHSLRRGLCVGEISVSILPRSDNSRFGSGLLANLKIISALFHGLRRFNILTRV